MTADDEAVAALARSTGELATRLAAVGARDEALGEWRRRRGLARFGAPRLMPAGRAWRLGALLLLADGALRATGEVTRAVDPRHPNNQSLSGEDRRDVRRAAFTGGFAEGETVDHGWTPIPFAAEPLRAGVGPVLLRDGAVLVRWAPGQGYVPLLPYLAERAGLLRLRDGWDERDTG